MAMISVFSANLDVKKMTEINVNNGANRLTKYGTKFM